jgi:glutathione S-transferase
MTPLFWQLIRTPEAARNPAVLAQAAQDAERCMRILDQHLASSVFMSADRFTVADIPVGAFVHRWLALPCDRPNLPAVQAYYHRMMQRTPYRTHVALALT